MTIDTSRAPCMTYQNETDADSVVFNKDPSTYRLGRLANGRVGVWYERSDRFEKAFTLTSRRNSDDAWVFPTEGDAKAYAETLGWNFDEYFITQ